ncbi:hypothetical protein [Saccharibacillus sp. O23]|uniref:hypothetical protein n=1 Tax=Saccharibacillus sp. O23 TaxID=2009338 RepID=UPI001179BD91|nr:hypothetical protein [Saccharibacillus sp. O23]
MGSALILILIMGIRLYAEHSQPQHSEAKKEEQDRNHGLKRVNMDASYIGFNTIEDLDAHADLILVGTPILPFEEREHKAAYYQDGVVQDFYTITDFKVDKVVKDSKQAVKNGMIQYFEPISVVTQETGAKVIYSIADYQEVQQGEKYLVFLRENDNGHYATINMNNGKFALEEKATRAINARSI